MNHIDVYEIQSAPYQLEAGLKAGSKIHFVGCYITEPSTLRLFSSVLASNEAEESTFVVVTNIEEIKLEGFTLPELSLQPVTSISSAYAALPTNCALPHI